MKKTLIAALLLLPTLAFAPNFVFAQSKETTALFDKADWPKDKVIDCKAAPKDAVVAVPKELANYARVVCTKTGHHFMAKRGFHWHHQADGLPPFFVSAAAASAVGGIIPETTMHKGYFTKIETSRVDYGSSFGKIYPAGFEKNNVVLAAHAAMVEAKKGALQVSLTTKNGETMIIHVMDEPKPYGFAYVATIPGTGTVVLMNDLEKVVATQKAIPAKPPEQKK
jgi:hypothetical protein